MKKALLTLLLALATCAAAWALTEYNHMYLYFKDGSVQKFTLLPSTEYTTTAEKFIVTMGSNSFEFDRDQVSHIKYGNEEVGLDEVVRDDASDFIVDDKTLKPTAIDGDDMLYVFAIDGKLILASKVSADDGNVDISMLQPGVYLVKFNGKTEKILVK